MLHELGAAASLSLADIDGETPAHNAAGNGHEGCLRVLHELGAAASLSAADTDGSCPAHHAALNGHGGCLRVLHELGAAASLSAADIDGDTPAHNAASNGHEGCLCVLHELGAAASLAATAIDGETPAHDAAANGHEGCLRLLHELGAAASLSAADTGGSSPAHDAALNGHEGCLRVLHELGAAASLSAAAIDGETPAHNAAGNGHEGCLRVLDGLGAGASLSAADSIGRTPAQYAALSGHEGCLRVLHELGAAASLSGTDSIGRTLAHIAAAEGHGSCLRVLHELGAAASLSAADTIGGTPAHIAALYGHEGCLHVLHELLSFEIKPLLQALSTPFSQALVTSVTPIVEELSAKMKLAWNVPGGSEEYPIECAARGGHIGCVSLLVRIGGATGFFIKLRESPQKIEDHFPCLLGSQDLLDLPVKQAWLAMRLQAIASQADASSLALVSHRSSVLEGLCVQFGVDELTGSLTGGSTAPARHLNVRFAGEAGDGDGLRREWFGLVLDEMLDLDRGLFVSKDGNRTLQPNPHSASTAGPDHLAYFALLGRITGLALYYREPLNASWSTAFLKAVFGYCITVDDLESVDPELYEKRLVYLRDAVYASRDGLAMDDLGLSFVDDSNDAALVYDTSSEMHLTAELKHGGGTIEVTEDNMAEYLQLFAKHRLVAAIEPQTIAFRQGLAVFLDKELQDIIRTCFTVAEVQVRAHAHNCKLSSHTDGASAALAVAVVWCHGRRCGRLGGIFIVYEWLH